MSLPSTRRARGLSLYLALAAPCALATACASGLDRLPDAQAPAQATTRPGTSAVGASSAPAPPAPPPSPDGYVYVARGRRVSIGLAEARDLEPEQARSIVDRLTAGFDACSARLEADGGLTTGAGRLIVLLDERGHVTATDAKLAPGSETAKAGLLCLISPARGLSYPPSTPSTPAASTGGGKRRGFAVEAVWEAGVAGMATDAGRE